MSRTRILRDSLLWKGLCLACTRLSTLSKNVSVVHDCVKKPMRSAVAGGPACLLASLRQLSLLSVL